MLFPLIGILIAYHFLWTEWRIFTSRFILKMIPISYWTYHNPSTFNVMAWIGDAALLDDTLFGLIIGVLAFSIAHQSKINFGWKETVGFISISFFFPHDPVAIHLVMYGWILFLHLWQRPSWGLGWMLISDALIGLSLLYPIPWSDTLTLGTYWIGSYLANRPQLG